MSKKNRSEKEVARLRREVEFLKTQVRVGLTLPAEDGTGRSQTTNFNLPTNLVRPVEKTLAPKVNLNYQTKTIIVDYSYLKKDLLKTAFLAFAAFASIFALYFYQTTKFH